MPELVQTILEYLDDNWMKFVWGIVIAGVGWYFGRRRAKASWKKQEFLNRVNVSLNRLENGVLQIRTISEKLAVEVFLNQHAAEQLQKYAVKTTLENPMIPIPASELWFYLNSLLNEISEKFSDGIIRQDLGLPVRSESYVICLTCECGGEVKTRKIRAMLMTKSVLATLGDESPKFEQPQHSLRWKTLKFLQSRYASHPGEFMEVTISQ